MAGLRSKPFRTVLRWQAIATAALTVIAGGLAGYHGALSAALGGLVSIAAGLAFVGVASMSRAESPGTVMAGALRAEGVKILVIVLLLWLVVATYESITMTAFVATFILATVLFSAAALVHRD